MGDKLCTNEAGCQDVNSPLVLTYTSLSASQSALAAALTANPQMLYVSATLGLRVADQSSHAPLRAAEWRIIQRSATAPRRVADSLRASATPFLKVADRQS